MGLETRQSHWPTRRSRLSTICAIIAYVLKMQIIPVVFNALHISMAQHEHHAASSTVRIAKSITSQYFLTGTGEYPDPNPSRRRAQMTPVRSARGSGLKTGTHQRKFTSADHICSRILSVSTQELMTASQTWNADRVMGWKRYPPVQASGATPRRHKSDPITRHKASRIPLQARGFSRNSLKSFLLDITKGEGGESSFAEHENRKTTGVTVGQKNPLRVSDSK